MKVLLILLATFGLAAQTKVDYPTQIKRGPMEDVRGYAFVRTNGLSASGDLSSAGAGKVITLTTCPRGLQTGGFVRISGGVGTAESVKILSTTCTVAGGSAGTLLVTTANTHTGSWTVISNTSGIEEAFRYAIANGLSVSFPGGTYTIYNTYDTTPLYGNSGALVITGFTTTAAFLGGAKIVCTDTTKGCIAFEYGSNALIDNMIVDYASNPADCSADSATPATVSFNRMLETTVSDLRILKGAGIAVLGYQSPNLRLENVRVDWSSRDGIHILNTPNLAISGATITNSGDDGVAVHGMTNSVGATSSTVNLAATTITHVSGDNFANINNGDAVSVTISGRKYYFWVTAKNSSTQLTVWPSCATSPYSCGTSIALNAGGYVASGTITSPIVRHSRASGIAVTGVDGLVITNPLIDTTYADGIYTLSGIYLTSAPRNVSIVGGVIKNIGKNASTGCTSGPAPSSFKNGINLMDITDAAVTGTEIDGTAHAGVRVVRVNSNVARIALRGLSLKNIGDTAYIPNDDARHGILLYSNSSPNPITDVKISDVYMESVHRAGLWVDNVTRADIRGITMKNVWLANTTLAGVNNMFAYFNGVSNYIASDFNLIDTQSPVTANAISEYVSTNGEIRNIRRTLTSGPFGFVTTSAPMPIFHQVDGYLISSGLTYASLASVSNGSIVYCSDCGVSAGACVGSGTGALAIRLNGVWRCTQ